MIRALLALAFCFSGSLAAQEVARPDVHAGDTWTYRSVNLDTRIEAPPYRVTVSFVKGGAIYAAVAQGEQDRDASWTTDWNPLITPDGSVFTSSNPLLRFPAKPGDRYAGDYVARNDRRGSHIEHRRDMRVAGWETVTVPAGTFRALRIEANGSYSTLWGGYSSNGTVEVTFWYVPEVRRWVKYVWKDSHRSGNRYTDELITFKLMP